MTQSRTQFEIMAHVLLPDHLHLILDPFGEDFSRIMQRLKMSFGALYRKRIGWSSGRVWQHRYWDHVIRDQADLNRHIDYIHYNPVKHGLVTSLSDWVHSSFQDFQRLGMYSQNWGSNQEIQFEDDFGE